MKTLLKTIGIVSTPIGSSFLFQNSSEKESIPGGIILPTDSVSSKIEIKNFSIEAKRLNVGATTTADFVSYDRPHVQGHSIERNLYRKNKSNRPIRKYIQ